MKKQKGFIQIILIVLVALILAGVGAVYYFANKPSALIPENTSIASEYQADYLQGAQGATSIKRGADLNKASSELDSADLTQIDKDLNALSADSSSF
jgi:flagellar basal body-associated protein FliL